MKIKSKKRVSELPVANHEKGKVSLKKVLFEPVAPYYADALNTLFSVVQGLAMGIYGYEISECFFKSDSIIKGHSTHSFFAIVEFAIMFLVICVLWHRYISHNQLYAWSLRWLDTVIPVLFGLLEVFLILTIQKENNLPEFSTWFACLTTWGLVGYLNTHYRFDSRIARVTYNEHFAEYGADFTKDFYEEVKRFEDKSLRELFIAFLLMWTCYDIIQLKMFSEETRMTIFGLLTIFILSRLLYDNIWRHLLKSRKLNAYPFWTEITKTQTIEF